MDKHKNPIYQKSVRNYLVTNVLEKNLLDEKIRLNPNADILRKVIQETQGFVGTITSISGELNLFEHQTFSIWLLFDEASQILEPNLLGILCARHKNQTAIDKFIFIETTNNCLLWFNNPKESLFVSEPELIKIGMSDCRNSLFETTD